MILYPGAAPTPGRWYYVDDSTPFFPDGDCFGSKYYLDPIYDGTWQIGEVKPTGYSFWNGTGPSLQCIHSFGDLDAWQGRANANSEMQPWCCGDWFGPGLVAEASGAVGSISVRLSTSGSAAELSAGDGSSATRASVSGSAAELSAGDGSSATRASVSGSAAELSAGDGSIVFVPGTPTNPTVTNCSVCSAGTYTYWYITCAGVTGSADCTAHNVTDYQMAQRVGSPCTWDCFFPSTATALWSMFLTGLIGATLFAFDSTGVTQAIYTCASFNCLGSNVFSLTTTITCSGWPATITLASS
jgi:hypothetical protein